MIGGADRSAAGGVPDCDVVGSQRLPGFGGGPRDLSSDTLSTHCVQPLGVAALKRWGLLDELTATGCPAIDTFVFDFGLFTISGAPGSADAPVAYAPRRIVLDKLLVDAAAAAGAEVREGFTVEEVLLEDDRVVGVRGHAKGGQSVIERARVVVGADGLHSLVAKAVQPEQYHEKPALLCGYYSYWSGLPMHGRFENYIRPNRGWAAFPTHDDLTLVVAGWPFADFAKNKTDVEGNYLRTFELAPEFDERIHSAHREARVIGTAVPGYFRTPFGPGWALVGDAGYNKDFITAQGIADAFQDAERCAAALDAAFSGARLSTTRWATTSPAGTPTPCPSTSSPPSSRLLNLHRRSCSSCSPPSTATRTPWTGSPGSTPA